MPTSARNKFPFTPNGTPSRRPLRASRQIIICQAKEKSRRGSLLLRVYSVVSGFASVVWMISLQFRLMSM